MEEQRNLIKNFITNGCVTHEFLFIAVKLNFVDIIKIILDFEKFDINVKNNHVVYLACCEGRLEILKLLLNDKRINIKNDINEYIIKALMYNKLNIVNFLVQHKDFNIKLFVNSKNNIEYLKDIIKIYQKYIYGVNSWVNSNKMCIFKYNSDL